MANKTNDKKISCKENNIKNSSKKTHTTRKNTTTKATTNKLEKNNSENTEIDNQESTFKLFNFKRRNKNQKMPILIRIIECILILFKSLRRQRLKYKDYDKKVYSIKCNFITLSIITMVCFFVYSGKNLLCTYPLITSVFLFMKFAKGINSGKENKHDDLKLYRKILKANIIFIIFIFVTNYENLWFFDFTTILIFIVPLMISKVHIDIPFKRILRLDR